MTDAPTPTTSTPLTRWHILLLVVLLLLGFALRFIWLRDAEYRYDDVVLTRLAQLQAGGDFQYFGMVSGNGGVNFPAGVHVLAPLFAVLTDLYAVVVVIVLWNVFGLGLFWLLVRRLFTQRIAFLALFLLAVNPIAVQFSRRVWAQEFNVPFLTAGFLLAVLGFVDRKRWAQVLALPLFVIGMQIHFAAFGLFPAFAYIVWKGRRSISWPNALVSVALAAVVTAPFVIGVIIGASDTPNIVAEFTERSSIMGQEITRSFTLKPLSLMANVAAGLGYSEHFSYPLGLFPAEQVQTVLAIGVWAALLIGCIVAWRRWRFPAVLLALAIATPVVAMITGTVDTLYYYFIMLVPPLTMLVAVGFDWVMERLPRRAALPVVAGFLLALGAAQIALQVQFFERVRTVNDFPYPTPLGYFLNARDQLPPTDDLILIGTRRLHSEGDIWRTLAFRQIDCVRELATAGGTDLVIVPHGPYTVMYGPESAPNPLYLNEAQGEIPMRATEPPYIYYRFDTFPDAAVTDGFVSVPPATFDGSLQFDGYRWVDGRMTLAWRVLGWPAVRTEDQFFVHVLDEQGERIAQFDAPFYPSRFWCPGDRLLMSFDLPRDDVNRAAILRVGLYRLDDGRVLGIDAYDPNGMASPWVDVPLREAPPA